MSEKEKEITAGTGTAEPVKKEEAGKKNHYISALRVIISVVVFSVICGIMIISVLDHFLEVRFRNNLVEDADSLAKAIVDTSYTADAADMHSDIKKTSILSFIEYSVKNTDESYAEIIAQCKLYNPEMSIIVMNENCEVIAKSDDDYHIIGKISPSFLHELVDAEDLGMYVGKEENKGVLNARLLDNGDYLLVFSTLESNPMASQVITPEDALASVMRKNENSLSNINYAFMFDKNTNRYYSAKGEMSEEEAAEHEEAIEDSRKYEYKGNDFFRIEIDDEVYYGVTKEISEIDNVLYYCSYPLAEIEANIKIALMVIFTFFMLLLILGLFLYYLRQYHWLYPEAMEYNRRNNQRKSIISFGLAIVFVGLVSYYGQTLFTLSINVLGDRDEIQDIRYEYEEKKDSKAAISSYYKDDMIMNAQLLGDFIGRHENVRTPSELSELTYAFSLQYIMLYDLDGKEITSTNLIRNYSFPTDPSDPAYCLNDLKMGVQAVYIEPMETKITQEMSARAAVNIYDSDGVPLGYLEIGRYPDLLDEMRNSSSLNSILQNTMISDSTRYIVVNDETRLITYSADSADLNLTASEIGLTEDAFANNYFGRLFINGESCYVSSDHIDGNTVFIIHPEVQVYLSRIPFTLFVVGLFLLSSLLTLLILRRERRKRTVVYASPAQEKLVITEREKELRGKDIQHDIDNFNPEKQSWFRSRVELASLKWMYTTPEKKLARAVRRMIQIGALVFLAAFIYRRFVSSNDSLLVRIVSGQWVKGVNVFSLTANLLLILSGIVLTSFIKSALGMAAQITDARGKTVTRLLRSACNYIAFITVLYFCLVNIGLNPNTLVTSAGLVGVAISISSRDLITDIIAGLFIIFEGTYKVGDIVDVGGYQGVIHEIGIRTTIITGWDLDEKSISNRNMSNVINMSLKNNYSIFVFTVDWTVDTDHLKELFREEFVNYKAKYPEIISTPFFSVWDKKLAGTKECNVMTEITELSRSIIERSLMMDIQDLLDRNQISFVWAIVPTNQGK
ncbi:MAG: mechanosensitive ion channel [Solobacterium sp.]|nr:mechanosensitive ion channel [Solobacterium sp.]